MATLSYPITYGDWSGTINLNYTAEYDRENNRTKITFGQCSAVYSSRADYQTTTDTNITVAAGDNSGSSGTLTLHTEGYGTGGTVTFTGTPSPASITVQHAAGAGAKTVSLSASTTAAVRPYSGSSLVYAGGSGSASLTAATLYTLTKSNGTGTAITVDNSTAGKTGLASGAMIAKGDVLKISFAANTGYELKTHTVNGSSFTSGGSHTVSGNVTVAATAALKSYKLTVSADGNAVVTVKRGTETLKSGDTVSHFDVLSVTVSAKSGYKISAADINGTAVSPDTAVSHTVSGPVTVTAEAEPLSNLFVDDGGTRRRVLLYIDDNGERALYRAVFK